MHTITNIADVLSAQPGMYIAYGAETLIIEVTHDGIATQFIRHPVAGTIGTALRTGRALEVMA